MNNGLIQIIFIFLFLFLVNIAKSTDTNNKLERQFSEEKFIKLKNKKQSQTYLQYNAEPNRQISFWELIFGFLYKYRFFVYLFRILPYIIIVLAVIFLFYKINKTQLSFWFKPTKKEFEKLVIPDEENIEQLDLDNLIKQAIFIKNYKLAYRYYYLKLLSILNQKKLINYEPYKLIYDYKMEIQNKKYYSDFTTASTFFEYSWYGNFDFSTQDYQDKINYIKTLNQKIQSNI